MKKPNNYMFLALAILSCNRPRVIPAAALLPVKNYPHSEVIVHKDTYFGTVVEDPYQWLENNSSEETQAWISTQNTVTDKYLTYIPYRDAIKKRLQSAWNYEKYSVPFKVGEYTYFMKNKGLENQWVLYRKKDEKGTEQVFLDPNTFSKEGTTSITEFEFSEDGSLMAYQISENGSDWNKIAVMRVSDKSIVGDTLVDSKFTTLAWKGNEGFFYSTYSRSQNGKSLTEKTTQHQLRYHRLNTPQSSDILILGGSLMPRNYILGKVVGQGRYLIATLANSGYGNELLLKDLNEHDSKFVTVVGNLKDNHEVIDILDGKIYIRTDLNAPKGKLVIADISKPIPSQWRDVIPQSEEVLQVSFAGGKFFANYLKDAVTNIKQYNLNGKFEHEIKLPDIGSVATFGVNSKLEDKFLYYYFTSYIHPGSIYKYEISTGQSKLSNASTLKFEPKDYESKQVFYQSKDGTKVPMIITYKKNIKLDGTNPTLLHGYGGFNISVTPSFDIKNIILLEQGGVLAVANLRGGGEYGSAWHVAGTKMQKQNTFDDFIAAAEYLIKKKYTSSKRLAIVGESNGGLLIGAVMTQRPDLFKVAFPGVGVLDMLRFNKFTGGEGWTFDYGSPQQSKAMFQYLHNYSPYHALKQGVAYPATLVTTADHDDRVVPSHSFKFLARMQKVQKGPNPVLIRVTRNEGHGAGKSTANSIEEQADRWAFMFHNMGLSYKDYK
ncbi:S9 family peptidase [Flavobacterium psychroterrae]|uniref:prolyl oligopeptidase n=1 Tax=Flavobacterium psychroterrae TaxID=2133767 RepID=A0ABS5PII2_9FLAO|nr:prolyl oligopeptidase family serine peptidase [Flavobacterium psychroterrae]MBS7234092.1 S9 family peptidase [Flavobacterium psychroterrae]